MKKIFLSIMAVAALAACTKSEVNYDGDSQIGFAPVAQNITKSVAGYTYGTTTNTFDGKLPNDIDLYVFANTQGENTDGTLTSDWPNVYFKNAQFIFNRLSNNVYEGNTPQYWPNVKSLIFAGYTEAGNIATLAASTTPPVMDFETNTLVINGYVQDNSNDSEGANDLMWFPWDGEDYKKQTNAVSVNLQHACSWITVKVMRDAQTTDETWKLDGLKINGLYHTGTATCGTTAATWDVSGATAAETLFSKTGTTLETTAVAYEDNANNMVVIPQTPTSIDVTYSYVPQTGVAAVTETVKGLSLKFNGDTKWQSGVHYIYTITITATEILIDPKVVGWVPEEVTPGVSI